MENELKKVYVVTYSEGILGSTKSHGIYAVCEDRLKALGKMFEHSQYRVEQLKNEGHLNRNNGQITFDNDGIDITYEIEKEEEFKKGTLYFIHFKVQEQILQ